MDVHARDRDLEGLLDRLADGVLGGGRIDLEGVLAVFGRKQIGLLREERGNEYVIGVH
jgi:hypothetical protein